MAAIEIGNVLEVSNMTKHSSKPKELRYITPLDVLRGNVLKHTRYLYHHGNTNLEQQLFQVHH